MPLRTRTTYLVSHLKTLRTIRFRFCLLCCSIFFLSLVWIELVTRQNSVNEILIQEALENVGRDLRYSNVYRKTKHLPKNLKYLLLWTRRDFAPFSFLEEGQRTFLKNNCSVINCYVTADKRLFGTDYTKFDAIAFNGRTMKSYKLPRKRSPHQKYIYFNMESAENFPVCNTKFDGFFNWTATYKLDSDLPTPYVLIRDKNRAIVGPKRRMQWKDNMENVYVDYRQTIENKTKMAAWFVSHCRTKSGRHIFVDKLQKALSTYGHNVDVFGNCGKLRCPRGKKSTSELCNLLLQKEYFFYLALENSFAEDYVTEKLLTAMSYSVIPVVFGGADYSRFIPPESYIDGRQMNSYQLAALMDRLARSPRQYSRYFRWKKYYTYHNPSMNENMCNICEALNDRTMMEKTTIYNNFRSWWNPYYKERCR
ncbi:unnamed protein product [Arctia plantaginis]|uniref:Fucosyltransferase n=1 Tax=Arctia plantaginis TaxID=874455 RepID=A0A8S0ZL96_ARCPL|nr:unnamed protein product [Arctia plantaginis]